MNLEIIGNIELLKSLLSLHYKLFDFYENELRDDPRSYEYLEVLKSITNNFKTKFELEKYYYDLFQEAKNRGLKEKNSEREIIYTKNFIDWQNCMLKSPTYIREIEATNFFGAYDISFVDDETIGFDYPVRNACKILNNKGYITYWPSANKQDYTSRKGHVIQNKAVAYILIDSRNLTDELKEKLLLNGDCDFWGVALEYQDNGKYYGIWSEISSSDTLCNDISNDLSFKALSLPILENAKNFK